jgi:hypothetical protein
MIYLYAHSFVLFVQIFTYYFKKCYKTLFDCIFHYQVMDFIYRFAFIIFKKTSND